MGDRNGRRQADAPSAELCDFWRERMLSTFTTPRPNGSPHVAPVNVTVSDDLTVARVICSGDSVKARNVAAAGEARVAVCQVDGRRWSTLEGTAVVLTDAESVRDAEARFAERYERQPRVNPKRVVLHITVDRRLGMR